MLASLAALLSGGTIVLNRMLNAESGTHIGIWPSTLINYITGLMTSLLLLMMTGAWFGPLPTQWYLYTGGLIGVLVVSLSSYASPHLPAFSVTLLLFMSQFLAGMVMDAFIGRATPWLKILGAGIVLAGLIVYVMGERATEKQN